MKIKNTEQKTTLDILSSALYKSYAAQVCRDGKILQIEERIGRKFLRTIDPFSCYGRKLLKARRVIFHTPDGEILHGQDLKEMYQKLKNKILERLQKYPNDQEWKRYTEKTLACIEGWEKTYMTDKT